MKIERKYLVLAAISGFLVAADQLTKLYVHANYSLGESHGLIRGFLSLTYVRNTGAAFGIFRSYPELFRQAFFLSMPPIAMIIIFFMLRTVDSKDRWQVFALSLIFGGAIGNYVDRLRFGFVIDFIDFHYRGWSYPAFNIADSAIVSGVTLLLAIMTLRDRAAKKALEQKV